MVRCGRRLKGSARASRGAGRDAVAPALTCRIGEATLGNQLTWRGRGSITRRRAEPRSLPLDPLSGLGRRLNFNSRVAHRPRLLRGDTRFLAMSKRGASHVRTGGLGGFNGSLPLLAPAEASARALLPLLSSCFFSFITEPRKEGAGRSRRPLSKEMKMRSFGEITSSPT
jgi:hypothetical protein